MANVTVDGGLTKGPLGCLARYSASRSSSSDAASTAVSGLAAVMPALNISLTDSGVAPAIPLQGWPTDFTSQGERHSTTPRCLHGPPSPCLKMTA